MDLTKKSNIAFYGTGIFLIIISFLITTVLSYVLLSSLGERAEQDSSVQALKDQYFTFYAFNTIGWIATAIISVKLFFDLDLGSKIF